MLPSFTPEEWARIDAILDDVLELDPADRLAAIDRACGGDARLRAHVLALVAADARADVFLETPAAAYAAGIVTAGPDERAPVTEPAGGRVGPYRIIREIGRGGMGRVFLADRADGQFEQQVALKLVAAPNSSEEIYERFIRERQILARLQHPNIARLLDGGMTPDGRPYFAMEYVTGEPITAYCDTHALDVNARLDLFMAVCEAVQYAHQNLVVHRDLKPTNTLVTPDGQVKLLDFGIAKVLHEQEAAGDATLTRLGTGPMTPEYAAPEQVRGEPVTTATDVYALGALAYELLTGRGPHRLTRLTASEVERAITSREVERPSASLGRWRSGEATDTPVETVARARRTEPEKLRRQLRGDLDTIVLQALQKDPARRYPTAGALLDDVRRYRNGLTVTARRDSLGYRTSKFVRRHALGVAATVLVLASLVAGLIGTAWQARVASQEAAKAREVSRFLSSLFEVADPNLANAADITARELLDRGASRIDSDLAAQPEVQAEMMLLLGRVYRQLGVFDRAQPLLDKSLALRRAEGHDDAQVADTLSELAVLALETGDPAKAEQLHRETLALRRAQLGSDHPDVGRTLRELASVLTSRGGYAEAESLQREALAIHERAYGTEHVEIASDLEGLHIILRNRGQLEAAIAAARRVLDMRMKLLGIEHLETATAMNNIAILMYDKWQLAEAERLYRHVLEFDLRRLGEMHPNTATVMNNLAFVLRDRGRYADAERLYRRALELDYRLFGKNHPYIGIVQNNLAVVVAAMGRHDEAERLFRDALALFRGVYGDEHWRVGVVQGGLAGLLRDRGDAGAEHQYREALARLERLQGPDHPTVEPVLIGLGRLLTARSRPAEAEPLLRRAVTTRKARLGDTDPRTAEAQVRLGACLLALGRNEEARPMLTAAYSRLEDEPHFRADAEEAARLLGTPALAGR
jgi:serine/threonine-protein kinase